MDFLQKIAVGDFVDHELVGPAASWAKSVNIKH